jgi:hypothetical protein
VKDRDFSQAVPQARHKHWAVASGAVVLLVTGAFVLVNEAARNALLRWATPWQNVERFTFARIAALPDPWVVPYAEPVELGVMLARDSAWKPGEARAMKQRILLLLEAKRLPFYADDAPVGPRDLKGRQRLAECLLRDSFSLQKIHWNPTTQSVIYRRPPHTLSPLHV